MLHAGTHIRSFSTQQRHRLALHVRTHQRAVGVIVFKERNQAGGNRDKLFRADVHVLNFVAMLQHEVAGLTSVHQIVNDPVVLVDSNVRLGDDVFVFFPSRQVIGVGFRFGLLLLGRKLAVGAVQFIERENLAHLIFGVARIQNLDFFHQSAIAYTTVGAFNKPVFVDARKARQRRDEADVRAFRRFDGADASVVSGMDVADFEAGALA